MRRALILGGTGLIGRAAASRLLAAGWQVEVTGRDPAHLPPALAAAGARFHQSDRADDSALARAAGDGADLLVDCVCYTAADAVRLLPLARAADCTVVLSSKAVYVDAVGNHVNSDVAPRFDRPITEDQPTMAPSAVDYRTRDGYGANKVAAEHVLLDSGAPVTVLRPSKVHGPGSLRPREWVFVRRVLDRRPAVILARRGEGADHTTAAANVAALIEAVAGQPGRRVLNSADPDAPSGLEIARTIAGQLDHQWDEVLLDPVAEPELGRHPWDAEYPIVLDMTAAAKLGYAPVGNYAQTVAAEVDWLVRVATTAENHAELPWSRDGYFDAMFDYAAEDRYLADRRQPPRRTRPGQLRLPARTRGFLVGLSCGSGLHHRRGSGRDPLPAAARGDYLARLPCSDRPAVAGRIVPGSPSRRPWRRRSGTVRCRP